MKSYCCGQQVKTKIRHHENAKSGNVEANKKGERARKADTASVLSYCSLFFQGPQTISPLQFCVSLSSSNR